MTLNQLEQSADLLIRFWHGEELDAAAQNACRQMKRLVVEKLRHQGVDEPDLDPQSSRSTILETLRLLAGEDPAARELIRSLTGDRPTHRQLSGVTQTVNVNAPQNQVFTAGGDMTFSSVSFGSGPSSSTLEAAQPDTRILLVEASPTDEETLRLTAELRTIEECIRGSKRRDQLSVQHLHAARIQDLQRALLEDDYQIIHFSGHGNGEMIFEDEEGCGNPIPQELLARLLAAFHCIECVILNACFSTEQASIIAKTVPFTVAMESEIFDDAAREFSRGFYTAIGAGRDYPLAYEMGCRAVEFMGYQEQQVPIFFPQSS